MECAVAAYVRGDIAADRDPQRKLRKPREDVADEAPIARACDPVDHVVAFVELRKKLRYLFRRVLEIVVDGDDNVSARGADARERRRMLSVIPLKVEAANIRILLGQGDDPVPTVVLTAVVDENDFVARCYRIEHRLQPSHEERQDRRTPVDRNDDRKCARSAHETLTRNLTRSLSLIMPTSE